MIMISVFAPKYKVNVFFYSCHPRRIYAFNQIIHQFTSSEKDPLALSITLWLKLWPSNCQDLPSFYLTEYCCMSVSPWYGKRNHKHTSGGGSPVIHRLEDNRQMMNDEDKWHSALLNAALNKWIPRVLLIMSMSFAPAMFQHKSC